MSPGTSIIYFSFRSPNSIFSSLILKTKMIHSIIKTRIYKVFYFRLILIICFLLRMFAKADLFTFLLQLFILSPDPLLPVIFQLYSPSILVQGEDVQHPPPGDAQGNQVEPQCRVRWTRHHRGVDGEEGVLPCEHGQHYGWLRQEHGKSACKVCENIDS